MKINYTRNFTKFAGSKEQALRIVEQVAKLNGDKLERWTIVKTGRHIKSASGQLKTFRWHYFALDKRISVYFTDGRPAPEGTPKKTYFIIWIEGFHYKTGDKIKAFDVDGRIIYTHKMTEAMRIRPENVPNMKSKLRRLGITEWVVESDNTFVKTHYVPEGTLFDF